MVCAPLGSPVSIAASCHSSNPLATTDYSIHQQLPFRFLFQESLRNSEAHMSNQFYPDETESLSNWVKPHENVLSLDLDFGYDLYSEPQNPLGRSSGHRSALFGAFWKTYEQIIWLNNGKEQSYGELFLLYFLPSLSSFNLFHGDSSYSTHSFISRFE